MTHQTLLKDKATWASSKSDGVELEASAARVKTNCKNRNYVILLYSGKTAILAKKSCQVMDLPPFLASEAAYMANCKAILALGADRLPAATQLAGSASGKCR
jgi:hypothetical protein